MINLRTNLYLAVLSVALVASVAPLEPARANKDQSHIYPLTTIRQWEHSNKSELELGRSLIHQIDLRLTKIKISKESTKNLLYREISSIIGFLAERPYPSQPKLRPELIHKLIKEQINLDNPKIINRYLQISLGLAGDIPDEKTITNFLIDNETPNGILIATMQSMLRSKVFVATVPALVRLTHNQWHYIPPNDMGPQKLRVVYPIQLVACKCLKQLGIECSQKIIPSKQVGQPPEVVAEVNMKSVITRLKEIASTSKGDKRRNAIKALKRLEK